MYPSSALKITYSVYVFIFISFCLSIPTALAYSEMNLRNCISSSINI